MWDPLEHPEEGVSWESDPGPLAEQPELFTSKAFSSLAPCGSRLAALTPVAERSWEPKHKAAALVPLSR